MHVAICGAGIAGLSLGHCLRKAGITFSIIERSPSLRNQGYMIDFFGSGYDAAQRMGLIDQLEQIHYHIARLVFMDEQGDEKFAIPYATFRKLLDNRHFNFLRGDLEEVLCSSIPDPIDIRYDTTIETVERRTDGVRIILSDGSSIDADLLVGAGASIHPFVR